ncbi:MAG: amino acid adenylation domain-containing protein, partial [Blastocatellia bacterium]
GEVKEYVRGRVPEYMVPGVVVKMGRLPQTANGKVDRKALPDPDLSASNDEPYVAPRNPVEEIVAGIFRDVLKLKQVGALDNFFNAGGNSLLATQAVSRIQKAFGIDFPLRRIFDSPSVESIAQVVEASRDAQQGITLPPIRPVPRDGELPLSFAQQRLWFIDQLDPNSYAYNMPGALKLSGPLDVRALGLSLNEILRRHEALRTTFKFVKGRPIQSIEEDSTLDLEVIDISNLDDQGKETYVSEEGFREARKPFNIAAGPLLRARLARLADDRHVLFITMHHIVSDGWSLDIFLREIVQLYEAFSSGKPSPLPELPIQYGDFAVWQKQALQGEVLESLLAYWKDKLSGDLPVLQLPADRPRPAVPSVEGDKQAITLSEDLSAAIKSLSRREGVTLFMTLTAAFKALLYRYVGEEDIVLGTPIANRNHAETEGLIGFFVNTLILRDNLAGRMSFRELLRRVRETAMDAYAHQDLPFEKLVDELQPGRDTSRNPLFQAMIVLQDAPMPEFDISGLTMSPVEVGGVTTKFIDLVLSVVDTNDGLIASFEYSTDLFEARTIARMLGHFETLLRGVVADADARLSDLPILTDAEREQILVGWNDTDVDYPFEMCMHQLMEINAEKSPDALAVISEEEQVTYKELNERANQVGHYLRSMGVGPEVLVGICAERSVDLIVGMLGILKAGGAYVPLDPEYPKDRLASMLEDAQVPILITQERLLERLPENPADVVCIDRDWPRISQESTANVESGVVADNLAFVLYTSGSTGRPKGVMIFHRAACNHIFWIQHRHPMYESDRMPLKYSICFDASVFEIFYTLYAGAGLVLARQGMQQDLVYLVSLMEKHKITILDLVGAQLQVLMDDERFLKCDWLRRVSCGNDAMLAEVKERYFREMGKELIHFYGPCEASIGSTWMICEPGGDHQVVSIGRPISNTQVHVVDPNMQPVPVGIVGEIVIGGIGVTRGYLRRPDLTADKFIPNPFTKIPGDRLYKTGDLARYRPDGTLEFAGRIDHQVKIRGFRIELGDIEAVIKDYPSVQEALVLARSEDEFATQQPGKLVDVSNGEVDPQSLAEHLALLGAGGADDLIAGVEALSEEEALLLLSNEGQLSRDAGGPNGKGLANMPVSIPPGDDDLIKSSQEPQLT